MKVEYRIITSFYEFNKTLEQGRERKNDMRSTKLPLNKTKGACVFQIEKETTKTKISKAPNDNTTNKH